MTRRCGARVVCDCEDSDCDRVNKLCFGRVFLWTMETDASSGEQGRWKRFVNYI